METGKLLPMSRTTLPLENKWHRYLERDSLRGLAAGSVVIWHFLMFWVTSSRWHRIVYSPTVFFYTGSAAVLIFFVLSGFVLSLPFLARPQPYPAYLAKRICRIYVP